jgi:nicotinamide-nucleotide amidase
VSARLDSTLLQMAVDVHRVLRARDATIAVAESLTGGLVGAALTDVSGSSATFRGGVVAYATELKASLLDVDAALLARVGAVHPEVAAAMAKGVAARLGATYGLATTGVAGPDSQDGHPPGEVHVALAGPGVGGTGFAVVSLQLEGGRDDVRRETVRQALALVLDELVGNGNAPG